MELLIEDTVTVSDQATLALWVCPHSTITPGGGLEVPLVGSSGGNNDGPDLKSLPHEFVVRFSLSHKVAGPQHGRLHSH